MAAGSGNINFKRALLGTASGRLITLNVVVFLLFNFLSIFISPDTLAPQLALSADPSVLLIKPWTVFTYMVTQWNLLHLISNMLWLWGFAYIMSRIVGEAPMVRVYILGGLVGALAFELVSWGAPAMLVGASASVCAVIGAVTFYVPNERVNLMFFGPVKMLWVGVIALVLMVMSTSTYNSSGMMAAHIAGAVTGIAFGYLKSNRGIDITSFMKIKFHLPKRVKVTPRQEQPPRRGLNNQEQEELDRILAKVKKSGYGGLTEMEKRRLFDVSKKIK